VVTLVYVFLGIIALSALLQAGLVVGIALGMRKAEAEVEAIAVGYDEKILPRLQLMEDLTERMADGSRSAVDAARSMELRISSFADGIARRLERTSGGMADTFDDTADVVESYVMPGIARRSGPFGQVRAVWAGLREGLALLRG
jgi:hypothetical protein